MGEKDQKEKWSYSDLNLQLESNYESMQSS